MALNPIAYTEKIVRSFLKYQLTAYPFSDPRLHSQMRTLLNLDAVRRTPLLKGLYVSFSRSFRQGAAVPHLVREGMPLFGRKGLSEKFAAVLVRYSCSFKCFNRRYL